MNAESVPYCVSRNADEIHRSSTSDVDLVVLPAATTAVENILAHEADLHGYRLIARIEFTNLCLVYWSPGADFVRIDLDGELRWLFFEVADAPALLVGAAPRDGLNMISPRSEWFVMADRLAWLGSLAPRYKTRVAKLLGERATASESGDSRIIGFVERGDAKGLRRHLIHRALVNPRVGIRSLVYAYRDIARIFRRICSPPGVFVRVEAANNRMDWNQLFRTMSMAFPEAKCARIARSPLPGLFGLFRGGIVIADHGHSFTAWICALFSSRCRRFRIVDGDPASVCDLVIPAGTNSVAGFADLLAAALATGVSEAAA